MGKCEDGLTAMDRSNFSLLISTLSERMLHQLQGQSRGETLTAHCTSDR